MECCGETVVNIYGCNERMREALLPILSIHVKQTFMDCKTDKFKYKRNIVSVTVTRMLCVIAGNEERVIHIVTDLE